MDPDEAIKKIVDETYETMNHEGYIYGKNVLDGSYVKEELSRMAHRILREVPKRD